MLKQNGERNKVGRYRDKRKEGTPEGLILGWIIWDYWHVGKKPTPRSNSEVDTATMLVPSMVS